jgi:hypothetical protein
VSLEDARSVNRPRPYFGGAGRVRQPCSGAELSGLL